MEKENLHFRHYCSARHNEKILAARIRHKAEGYAAYFMILERLLESHDHMSTRNYNNIAYDLRMSASVVKSVVEDFGLFTFTEDGTHFFSEYLNNQNNETSEMREKKRLAGIKSGESRRNRSTTQAEEKPCPHTVQVPIEQSPDTSKPLLNKENEISPVPIQINENKQKETAREIAEGVLKNDPINYKSILDLFNSLLGEYLPEVKSLSYKRKEMIKAIIKIHGPDKIREAFEQTLRSPFLLGMNDKGWKCSFDWILRGSNFIKVLEGNYLATRNRTLFDHPSTERLKNKTYEPF